MIFDSDEIGRKNRLLIIFLKSISKDSTSKNNNNNNNVLNDFTENKVPYINDTRYKRRIKILKNLYLNTGYRHSYSEISNYLTNSKNDIDLASIADNMSIILGRLLDSYDECLLKEMEKEKYSEFIEIVFKLNDHISLEAIRLNDLLLTERILAEQTKKAEEKIENKAISINRELTKIQNSVNDYILDTRKNIKDELKNANNEINGELKKARSEYITILGIFASIIIAFVAGLTFSTSVLSNIDKASIYRLAFIVCLVGLFITNILHYLYAFIRDIHFGIPESKGCVLAPRNILNSFCNSYIFKFNLLIILVMASIFVYWKSLDENTKTSNSPGNIIKEKTIFYAKE
ncbi:hypothetical protein ACNO6Z_10540 [Aliarcobacter lanthieri]|uniref:hypothetical protein n=1 Tax=Aliarcobacter lanthieri TaxID=1355374 RepID=UPI003AA989B4